MENLETQHIVSDGQTKYDLEERLIDFSVLIIDFVEGLPNSNGANHLGAQLLRSGTSPALNYGEAQAAESMTDFVHKMKVCLKELRESRNNLKILIKKNYLPGATTLALYEECDQLVRIFSASIRTAKVNQQSKK
jgi:four helix bundle protein